MPDFDFDRRPLPPPQPPAHGGSGGFLPRPDFRPPFDDDDEDDYRRRPDFEFESRPSYRPHRPDYDFENSIYGDQRPSSIGYRPSYGAGYGSGELDLFDPVGYEKRLKDKYIRRTHLARSVNECKDMCIRDITCRSFNYR